MTTTMSTAEAKKVIIKIAKAVLDTIKENPDGAPLGIMYAACMTKGISHDQFMGIINGLKAANRIKVVGHVAYPV